MIYVNDEPMWEEPQSCGTCIFFTSGASSMAHPDRGHCRLFDEMHGCLTNPPRRCAKLFKKGFVQYPEGSRLAIVINHKD